MLLNHYRYQIINNFEKLLEQKNAENTLKMTTLIFLTICMHIGPIRHLEVGPLIAKYDLQGKLCKGYTSANWGNNSEIEETMAVDNNKDNNKENPQEKNRQLKKKKQCLKQQAARAKVRQQSDYDHNKAATGAGFPIFLLLLNLL